METLNDIPPISEKVTAICRRFWKVKPDRTPAKDCCHGCPIYQPCNSGSPHTVAGMTAYAIRLNHAAEEHSK